MATANPVSSVLSASQLLTLAEKGEERTAEAGEKLFAVGDPTYPLIAIVEGEVAVLDASGNEIVRHGASGFLGEMNLLTGQTVYLTAIATEPLRYIAVDRDVLRPMLFEDGPLSDLLLSTFIRRREVLQRQRGMGVEVIGPRTSTRTRELVDFCKRSRTVHHWTEADSVDGTEPGELPIVRLPGGLELRNPSNGELARAIGVGAELDAHTEVDLLVVGGGPAGLGAAVYGASEGLETLIVESDALGGQAGSSRRIENYLGFPAGITGNELTTRAVTQARKFHVQTATPYRAVGIVPGTDRHLVQLDGGWEVAARSVVLATGANYRRLPVDGLADYEGISVFYAAGPAEGDLCAARRVGVVGGGNSAAQAAVWLANGGALVTVLHRRKELSETMSQYLIDQLENNDNVTVRDTCEIAELHGSDGELEAVTLEDGERVALAFLFLFLGAVPCTDWLGEVVARDDDGFVLTGAEAGADGLLETSVPGIFAAGDVRSGSTKRCATAVGEGGSVIGYVHRRLAGSPV